MKTPIEIMMGASGEPPHCTQFMHLWNCGDKEGTKCLCGKEIKKPRTKKLKPAHELIREDREGWDK